MSRQILMHWRKGLLAEYSHQRTGEGVVDLYATQRRSAKMRVTGVLLRLLRPTLVERIVLARQPIMPWRERVSVALALTTQVGSARGNQDGSFCAQEDVATK